MNNIIENRMILNESATKVTGEYLRIRPGTDISINTPILNINIGYALIKPVKSINSKCMDRNNIFKVNIKKVRHILDKKHNHMFESPDHINDYVPVGQVDTRYRGDVMSSSDPNISIILANTRVVPMSKQYRKIRNNVWLAELSLNGIKMRSIGTIYSKSIPKYGTPVFPISYLKEVSDNEPNYDIYSDREYGRYTLNDNALNIDKKNLRMIGTTGDISLIPGNAFIPSTPDELYEADINGMDMVFNRKIYFTAQGSIANDPNCVSPGNNMMKMNQMECNGIATTTKSIRRKSVEPMASDTDDLKMNERVEKFNGDIDIDMDTRPQRFDNTERNILTDREKQLILREKDEPWFTDPEIVGDVAIYDDPHTITGHNNTFEATNNELYDIIDSLKPKGSLGALKGDSDTLVLIGTFDGDTEEINMPFESDCKMNPVIGYSRYDKMQKCLGRQNRNGLGKQIEPFDSDKGYNPNNTIMWVMCFIILALMVYRLRIR
jgi:hypothetical protein